MIKRFLFLALALLALAAPASAQLGTVPNTFVEGVNIIDDLNENFTTAYSTALNRTGGIMTGQLTSQAIVPATTATYDLGSTLVKFRDAWFSRNVDIAGTLNVDGALSDSNTALQVNDQFQITSTTSAQFQSRYDSSNYWEASTSNAGAIVFNAVGASAGFTFSDSVTVSGTLTATTFAAINTSGDLTVNSTNTTLTSVNPILKFIESDAAGDEKRWRLIANSSALTLQTLSDSEAANNSIWSVTRSGATVSAFSVFPNLVFSTNILSIADGVGNLGATTGQLGNIYLDPTNSSIYYYTDGSNYSRFYRTGTLLSIQNTEAGNTYGLSIGPSTISIIGSNSSTSTVYLDYNPVRLRERPASPGTALTQDAEVGFYLVDNKFVLYFNDAGTTRYKYLDMTGTGVTWVHTTSAP